MAQVPSTPFDTSKLLVKRLRIIQKAKSEFGTDRVKEVFPSLVKQRNGSNINKMYRWET